MPADTPNESTTSQSKEQYKNLKNICTKLEWQFWSNETSDDKKFPLHDTMTPLWEEYNGYKQKGTVLPADLEERIIDLAMSVGLKNNDNQEELNDARERVKARGEATEERYKSLRKICTEIEWQFCLNERNNGIKSPLHDAMTPLWEEYNGYKQKGTELPSDLEERIVDIAMSIGFKDSENQEEHDKARERVKDRGEAKHTKKAGKMLEEYNNLEKRKSNRPLSPGRSK